MLRLFTTEIQNAFRYGRSGTDQIFCLKLLIEKGREFNLETHWVLIDCEKVFDNVKRQILLNMFNSRHIADTVITKQCIFTHTHKTFIKFNHKISKPVKNNKAVPQSCSLSAALFNTWVGTLIVATIYLQLIQNRYVFRSFTVLQCSHQHCAQPVASDVEFVGSL